VSVPTLPLLQHCPSGRESPGIPYPADASTLTSCATSKNEHRITERLGLEETIEAHLVQLLCHGQGHVSLDQVAQSPMHPNLEHLQGGDTHSFSGQPVTVSHHSHHKTFLPYVQSKPTLFQF